ncbi:MAG: hypothetical protein PHD05_01255 [Sphaerochaetaceae bacterium]|jgi:hypothetical protein|nr:hypothetical protein [Sphaerochaetaceae bacterium]
MVSHSTKNQNSTQVVISSDQNFILAKNIGNFTDIISPFKKINDNKFSSKFTLPITQLHRIQSLYGTIPTSQYTVIDDNILFDCINSLPIDIFNNAENGYIHFSTIKQHKTDNLEIIIDPKLLFQYIDSTPVVFDFECKEKIKFKSNFLKAFPVILKSGFIFSLIDKSKCQLFISVENIKNHLIGECSKYEIINMIQYILPICPLFSIHIEKQIKIYFQQDFAANIPYEDTTPILLYVEYDLEQLNKISIMKIAQNVKID